MFAGKTVVITGASSGLGRALSISLSQQQSRMVLAARNREGLAETERLCKEAGAETLVVPTDVTKPEDCQNLVERTVEKFGSLDHLVINAGVSMWAKFEDIEDLSIFTRLMEVNYLGAVYVTHPALPHLKKSKGLITAISSIQGKLGVPFHTGYVASKHALEGFLNSLRMELEGTGVDILIVEPSWIRGTEMRTNAFSAEGSTMGDSKRKHSSSSLTVETVSRKILKAMRKRKRDLAIPYKYTWAPFFNSLVPRLVDKIVMKKVHGQKK